MSQYNIELPDSIRLTSIQMALYEIVHISHHEPEIKEKVLGVIAQVQAMDKVAENWRKIMFQIANKIN